MVQVVHQHAAVNLHAIMLRQLGQPSRPHCLFESEAIFIKELDERMLAHLLNSDLTRAAEDAKGPQPDKSRVSRAKRDDELL
jgi:hypothetical protein